ncbi:MAG TPA: 16S rRNA (adenine(1518)-N(6)/adenine(1519)-N(6))-dimethyltransferase RsmA [Armatimonadota bacterium]|nr:16S rRNA (adenine(1518)-N(6)/adenine(1519)-N(6))-dimethyltransferase RsmA [Armatimonadota bacterium]
MAEPTHLDLTAPGTLVPLLQQHGFHTSKGLGQHFLISRKVLEAIVNGCELESGLPVLEIGPGVGTVTRELAERGATVSAVELDTRALAVLQDTVGEFPAVTLIHGDILAIDLPSVLDDQQWTVVGNLPYYITTPVISKILELGHRVQRAVFMIQREVADRLASEPGSKVYGALSVYAQVYATIERIVRVPPGAFLPPPSVESAVVRLNIRPEPLVPDEIRELFFSVVRAAFGQRRKTLGNALAGGKILGGDRALVDEAITAAGISPSRRGETLDIAEFRKISEEVASRL